MQSISLGTYYQFGTKSFLIKVFRGLMIPVLLLVIFIISLVTKNSEFLLSVNNFFQVPINAWLVTISGVATVIAALVVLSNAWIDYVTNKIMINESSFSLVTGLVSKSERSFPLRHVNNVSEQQGPLDQIIGTCTCVIEMTSDDDGKEDNAVTLHDMDQVFATALKELILQQANTQKMKVS